MSRRITTLWKDEVPYHLVATERGFVLEKDDYSLVNTNIYSEYSDAYDALEDYILEIGGQTV